MTVVVQHDDFLFGDQKLPSAPDAVVEPRLTPKQRAVAKGPDNKLVPNAWRMPLRSQKVAFPKLHEKAVNAFSGPHGKAAQSKPKLKLDHRARMRIMLQNEMWNAF